MKNILPFFTTNVARVLGLDKVKGKIAKGFDADITILDKETLDVRHVFSMGRHVLNEGEVVIEIKDMTSSGNNVRQASRYEKLWHSICLSFNAPPPTLQFINPYAWSWKYPPLSARPKTWS